MRIAVITPLELEYSARLLEGAADYSRKNPEVVLIDLPYPVDAPNALRIGARREFDGAVAWATHEARWVEGLLQRGIPLVSCSSDLPKERVPCIAFSSEAVVSAAVGHLRMLQPEQVVNLEFRIEGVPAMERRTRLFTEKACEMGLKGRAAQVFRRDGADDSPAARRQPLTGGAARRLISLLRELPLPSAIWCGDDLLAVKVCAAAAELGLRIPEDVAVLGLGAFRASMTNQPKISTIPLPGEVIGYRAVAELVDHIRKGKVLLPYTPVDPPPVVVGGTTFGTRLAGPVARARAFLARHGSERVTVAELASAAGVSPQSLHALFVREAGMAPGEMIRQARLDAAKRLLTDPRLSISRIAHLCGFNQQSKFASFFRRGTGLSPRAWRQRQV